MGSTHAGQRVRGRRCLAAGDNRDGGAVRKCSTGHHSIRGFHLRVPGSEAHPLGVVVGAGVAGKVAGDEVQRRQQLRHPRDSATEHGRGRCGCLRAHGIVLSTMVCSDTSCGGCGHGGDITGGVEFSAKMGLWPRG